MIFMARNFFVISVGYLIITTIWVFIFVEEPGVFLENNLNTAALFLRGLVTNSYVAPAILLLVVLAKFFHGGKNINWREILAVLLLGLLGITVSSAAFSSFETTFIMVMPFYADNFFAEIDRLMFFGQDAWVLAHNLIPQLGAYWVDFFYLWTWVPLVFLFPVVLLLFDADKFRVAKYLLLYFFSLIVVGNVIALAALSVGPVYFDAYYGREDFIDLPAALESSGVWSSRVGQIQQYLGKLFFENDGSLASDVAAFPSVHVSAIMVVALYVFERSKTFGIIAAVYVLITLFLSVYTGYHWLVDGIASIFLMIAANIWLKRSWLTKALAGHRGISIRGASDLA